MMMMTAPSPIRTRLRPQTLTMTRSLITQDVQDGGGAHQVHHAGTEDAVVTTLGHHRAETMVVVVTTRVRLTETSVSPLRLHRHHDTEMRAETWTVTVIGPAMILPRIAGIMSRTGGIVSMLVLLHLPPLRLRARDMIVLDAVPGRDLFLGVTRKETSGDLEMIMIEDEMILGIA